MCTILEVQIAGMLYEKKIKDKLVDLYLGTCTLVVVENICCSPYEVP